MDVELRNRTYAFFVAHGRAPLAEELGDPAEVEAGWRELHDLHQLVLEREPPLRLRMLNPFSCVPTPHRAHAAGRWWYGNCAWDSLGVIAALGGDGVYVTSCPDCAEPLELEVRRGELEDAHAVFHLVVPATQWWDDIVFT